jgi:hypothetical protein
MLEEIVNHIYTRILIAFVLSLILAFSDELEFLKNPVILFAIGIMTFLLVTFDVVHDIGITLLMCCLFVLVYNIQIREKTKK